MTYHNFASGSPSCSQVIPGNCLTAIPPKDGMDWHWCGQPCTEMKQFVCEIKTFEETTETTTMTSTSTTIPITTSITTPPHVVTTDSTNSTTVDGERTTKSSDDSSTNILKPYYFLQGTIAILLVCRIA
jgi:hypothetical protein